MSVEELELTEEQRGVRETVRRFATERIAPLAAEIDRDDAFPWDIYGQLAELGVLGATAPEEYGGAGFDEVSMCLALEELAAASGTVANAVLLAKLQSDLVVRIGTEEQAGEIVGDITSGRRICLIAVTEPGAGSDVANIGTTARRDGAEWVLDGTKAFMTAGAVGEVAVVLARTGEGPGHRGLSTFLVDRSPDGDPTKGFVVDHKDDLMGLRGLGTAGLAFAGTRVPAANLLGEPGRGFHQVMGSFDNGRIAIASLALGLAVGAYDASLDYARERQAFGGVIGDLQAVQFLLADMAVGIDAARLLIHQAARLKDRGADYSLAAARAKLFASDHAQRVATDAVQIHGGFGFTKEAVVERIYRDVKLTQIYEGTNQIQRTIIARKLLAAGASR